MQLVAAKNIEIKSLNNAAAEAEMAPRGLLFCPFVRRQLPIRRHFTHHSYSGFSCSYSIVSNCSTHSPVTLLFFKTKIAPFYGAIFVSSKIPSRRADCKACLQRIATCKAFRRPCGYLRSRRRLLRCHKLLRHFLFAQAAVYIACCRVTCCMLFLRFEGQPLCCPDYSLLLSGDNTIHRLFAAAQDPKVHLAPR